MNATPLLGTWHRLRGRLRLLFGKKERRARSAPRVVASSLPTRHSMPGAMGRSASVPAPVTVEPGPVAQAAAARPPVPAQPVERALAPAAVSASAPAATVQPAAVPAVPAKTMRSLEEVRADLARLRESAKQRHARAPLPPRRDSGFAPTDFMDFPAPAKADKEADEAFERTAFLDFTVLKPPAGR